ncbi:MAG: universal stress protein [Verrucomicrobiales bacterium]|nr:universal stress protein [Verrucomicrobiales bacterium]
MKAELLTGAPDEAIVKKAAAAGSRWVVVSSLGKRAPERWLLGSVSERTAETSPVPTLVVRQDEPLIAWAAGRRPLRILCAYDFTATADAALSHVKGMRRVGPCEVVVAQVDWPFGEKLRLGIAGPVSLEANQPEVQAILERDLSERVATVLGKQDVRIRVEPGLGRPDFRLIDIAKAEQADVIVTGAHQWRGVERLWHVSTSRGLLHYAPMSVLVVPAPTEPVAQSIPELRRVLVATDFSALGNQAVPQACATLSAGGSVKLIHVIPPWELPGPLLPHYEPKRLTKKQHKQLAADSLKKLRALIPQEAEVRGIVTEVETVEGADVAKAITQAAERFGSHLVCLGSHGRSGVSKALLGSVAQKVMAQSRRPVLVVREARK